MVAYRLQTDEQSLCNAGIGLTSRNQLQNLSLPIGQIGEDILWKLHPGRSKKADNPIGNTWTEDRLARRYSTDGAQHFLLASILQHIPLRTCPKRRKDGFIILK